MKFSSLLFTACCFLSITAVAQTNSNNGKQTAFITAVNISGASSSIDADFVQMLTGKTAVKAARKTGEAEFDLNKKGDTTWFVPNDYFILNENKKIRTFTLSAAVKIMLVKEGGSSLAKADAAHLKRSFKEKLFNLTIVNSEVTMISEIYTP